MPSLRFARSIPTGCFVALAVAAVLACSRGNNERDDNQFREDVLWCEEAVARLETCCPSFDARRIVCRHFYSYHEEGCGPETTIRTEPALSLDESKCIERASCDELVTKGTCGLAIEAGAERTTTTTTDDGDTQTTAPPPRRPVCP